MLGIGIAVALLVMPARAQEPVVQCQIGAWHRATGAGVCTVLRRDSTPLRMHHGSAYGALLCQRDLVRDLDLGGPSHDAGLALSTAAMICSEIAQANPEWVRR